MTKNKNIFKVGDKVIGTTRANGVYGVTGEGWKGVIIEILVSNMIRVQNLPGQEEIDTIVDAKYFELIKKINKPNNKKMKNLAGAARALKLKGPKKDFRVNLIVPTFVKAVDEEQAEEIAQEQYANEMLNINTSIDCTIKSIEEVSPDLAETI